MENHKKAEFKDACARYLFSLSIADLRVYGRQLGLPAPTKLKKTQLVEDIVAVLCEEKVVERTKRGAPIKNKHCEQEIPLQIGQIKSHIFEEQGANTSNEDVKVQEEQRGGFPLQISVNIEKLSEKQRQLLQAFLDSF